MRGLVARPGPRGALAAALLVLLAGCAGSSEPQGVDAGFLPTTASDPDFDEETGAVRGYVLDDQELPLPRVEVLLVPGDQRTTSALDGSYAFSFVAPGRYTLVASRVGFFGQEQDVLVVAANATRLDFRLEPRPVRLERSEVLGPFEAYVQCHWSTPDPGPCGYAYVCDSGYCADTKSATDLVWTNDNHVVHFALPNDEWREIVFEAWWEPSSAVSNPELALYFSATERTVPYHWFTRSPATESPLWWNYSRDVIHNEQNGGNPQAPELYHDLIAWLEPRANLTGAPQIAHEQRWQMMITIFYNMDAPPGYTAFPGE